MKHMKTATLAVAKILIKTKGIVTSIDVKNALMKKHPEVRWRDHTKGMVPGVTELMNQLVTEGKFTYSDGGVHRVYCNKTTVKALVKPTKKKSTKKSTANISRISRTKARSLMSNNKGRFFTAHYIKKDGTNRIISATYLKDQTGSDLGYVKVKDTSLCRKTPGNCIRNVNMQTIYKLVIGGKTYSIR